ncbi:hypothetical protein [Ignatzschineria sp. LJL83]
MSKSEDIINDIKEGLHKIGDKLSSAKDDLAHKISDAKARHDVNEVAHDIKHEINKDIRDQKIEAAEVAHDAKEAFSKEAAPTTDK